MRIVFIILLSSLFYSISLPANNIENYDNLSCFLSKNFEEILSSIESDSVIIFTNGVIYINADKKVENLLVVKGSVADYNVNLSNYPGAKIIDLKGAVAYPGFNDSHVHLMETSPFIVLGIDMKNCLTSSDIINSLASNVSKIKDGELMIGVGFSLENYDNWSVDDLRKIDSITGNRLVFLGDKLGHNVIVNSATMNYCNVTSQSEVPMGGILGGKNTGKLTGMFRESAMTLVGNKIFQLINKDLIKNTSLQMFKTWASFGYTGIVDLMGAAAGRILHPEIAMELENEGKLPIRIHYCYTIFDLNEIDSAVKYKDINSDMVRFVGCKLFVDGAYAAGQAWTSWVNMKGNNGLYYVFPTDSFGIKYNLNRIVEKLEEKGLNCHYHIQGDQGIENLLNALDNVVAKKGRLDCKHTIIHSAFITKLQMQRIVNFKGAVVMTTQPGFWEVEDNLEYYYGEHFYTAYPVKDIIDEGITVGMSTDFTVSPISYCPASKVIGVAVTG
jgi:predicted amidohydrolase YtcJ